MARFPLVLLIASLGVFPLASQPVLIDTDGGSDDLMAMAFLLAHPTVHIEAITVANGLVHVDAGARNVLRLLELAGRRDVPVFAGRPAPLRGDHEFPAEWRRTSDELPGVDLPQASRLPEKERAADYLASRLKDSRHPVRILALGPLTNLAEAIQKQPEAKAAIREIVMMGGAVHVPGNLGDGGVFQTGNKTAEWNIFVDPLAARIVFRSGVPIRLVPLDATNQVPINAGFLRAFAGAVSPLGRFVRQVLETDRPLIDSGFFYAWDPLAAVAMLHPGVVKTTPVHIDVLQDPPQDGRTAATPGRPNVRVALGADAAGFQRLFLEAFRR